MKCEICGWSNGCDPYVHAMDERVAKLEACNWPATATAEETTPSDQDVRAALVLTIRAADCTAFENDIADAIFADPILGKLLRGGR